MSKKILSVLLAVVMVITASFGGMTVSAEGLTNYVGDGGFENANFSGTIPNYGTGSSTDIATWGRFSSGVTRMELVTSDSYTGDDSVALNGNKYMKSGVTADGNYIRGFGQRLELTAGDYILTFIAKSDAGNLFSAGVYPTTENSIGVNKAIAYTYLDATNYWKEYTVDFTVPSDGIYYLMIGGNSGGDANIRLFYMDNVAVYAKSEIININAEATVGGTVTGGGVVAKGDTITLTATAKSGYEFTGWSDGVTDATRTFTATEDVSYTANFEKLSADYVPNGDFEADDWALSDYWTTLSGNSAFAEVADPENANNTVAYAKGGNAATTMLSKNTITLKDGHTYYIRFNTYMAEEVSGNGTSYYRAGFLKPGSTSLAGANFYGNYSSVYGHTTSTTRGTWINGYSYSYTHSGADVQAHVVIGMYNNECTSDWYVDDIVAYDEADLCEMTVTADKGGSVKGAKSAYFKGEELTLTAVAVSGYEFAGWSDGETSATRTITAFVGAVYHAMFTRKPSDNIAINGDFEDDTCSIADVWDVVNGSDKVFKKGTEANGNTYAYATPETRNSLASDVITVKPGETYTLTFDSMFIDSGKALTGDTNGFYRYGFIEPSKTDLRGASFTVLAGNNFVSYAPASFNDDWFENWRHSEVSYTNTGDADVQVKAVIGYFNHECGYEWRVDNVRIYNVADALNISVNAENGYAYTSHSAPVTYNTEVWVAAAPFGGYVFEGWYEDGVKVSDDQIYKFNISANRNLVAKCVPDVTAYTPDVDNDGVVNLNDLVVLAQYVAEWGVDVNEAVVDVNGSGATDLNDVTLLAQYLAGWDVKDQMVSNKNVLPNEDLNSATLKTTLLAGESEYYNKSAVINEGNKARIANLFKKAQRGEELTIVGFGGSITEGAKATSADKQYGEIVAQWFSDTFNVKVNYINSGIGSTPSLVGIHRIEDHVFAYNPDLVLVDFTTNDNSGDIRYRAPYETVLRRILEDTETALISVVFGPVSNYDVNNGLNTNTRADNSLSAHLPSMLYYDVPVIDYFGSLWRYINAGVINWTDVAGDYIHPSNNGHLMAASAINYYLSGVLTNLYNIDTTVPALPENYFFGDDIYEIATFLGGEDIDPVSNTNFTVGKVHGTKLKKGWVCTNSEGGKITFEIKDVTGLTLFLQFKSGNGTGNISVNGKSVVSNFNCDNASTDGYIWVSHQQRFDEPTDVTITVSCDGLFGFGPIGVTYAK